MRRDIDDALNGWPYDPEPGEPLARVVRARDGRKVIQVRVELGVLQLEQDGRPDGVRPHGFQTYLDYLRYRAESEEDDDDPWIMEADHCVEADREFVQFYHRRIAWLSLNRYDRALDDADHTLALMDFVFEHAPDEEYVSSHERLRGLVLFHRTQAAVAVALERHRPDEAIDALHDGTDRLLRHQREWEEEFDDGEIPDLPLVEHLKVLEGEIRSNFGVGKTLREQLDEAVQTEDYEAAARLRDQIRDSGPR